MISLYTLDLNQRHAEEERFHDQVVADHETRGGYFYDWGLSGDAISFARNKLGPMQGRLVLDFGCGTGNETLYMAERGALVLPFDISMEMAKTTLQLAQEHTLGSSVFVTRMAGEDLGYADDSLDAVFGISVLHHLEMRHVGSEIYRVLKPGGKAVFVEPLDYNPLLNLFRKLTPQRRSKTERPLIYEQLAEFSRPYRRSSVDEFGLTTLAAVLFPWEPVFRTIVFLGSTIDRRLFTWFPQLRRYCWIAVIEVVK